MFSEPLASLLSTPCLLMNWSDFIILWILPKWKKAGLKGGKPRCVDVNKLLISRSFSSLLSPTGGNPILPVPVPKVLELSLAPHFLSHSSSPPSANAVRSTFQMYHKSNHFSLRQPPLKSKSPSCLTWIIAKKLSTHFLCF